MHDDTPSTPSTPAAPAAPSPAPAAPSPAPAAPAAPAAPSLYYKILTRNGEGQLVSCHGGTHTWVPGEVYGPVPVRPCHSGFHACRISDLSSWLIEGMEVWEVFLGGDGVVVEDNKVVGATATLGRCYGRMPLSGFVAVAERAAARATEYARYASTGEGTRPSLEVEARLQGEDILSLLEDVTP